MGKDNLFHKRKAKKVSELARRGAIRSANLKVLIVCEGEKTEPNYFLELRDYYKLNSAFVKITGESGSSPTSVIKHAQELYKRAKEEGDQFDKVYCVIDKDCHSDYERACNIIFNLNPKNIFVLINSVPCFEYWLLLHFKYTTTPYTLLQGNPPSRQVFSELKKFLPNYSKGRQGLFKELFKKLDTAIQNSKNALKSAHNSKTDMPSTYVHSLIEFLQDMAIERS